MTIFRWPAALALMALALFAPPALAANDCGYPENTAGVTASGQLQALCDLTKAQRGASSTPLIGSASASQVAGPFTPQLGRPINLSLTGTWVGTVLLLRSIDGGATKLPLTIGGTSWAAYTANANEPVWIETEASASYYLAFTWTSGTVAWRVAQ